MAKTLKHNAAGCLCKVVLYDRGSKKDTATARAAKKRAQSDAQSRLNGKNSAEKLEFMLAANFKRGDLIVLLTYDDEHLPFMRKTAQNCMEYFRKKMVNTRKAAGQDFVCVWNTEFSHEKGRYHHHAVINSTGDDIDDLKAAWKYGQVSFIPLRVDKEKNYATQARYMCKEYPETNGSRVWSYTHNCKKPEQDSFCVSDDTVIQIPEDAIILEEVVWSNQYTSFRYVKYIAAHTLRAPKAKRKHRRRFKP